MSNSLGSESRNVADSSLRLIAHTMATGGALVARTKMLRLTPIQYELLAALRTQLGRDADRPAAVRGFISSYELLSRLPWDSRYPEDGHLKQLIRRVRRRIASLGLDIEACQGFGYRLATLARDGVPAVQGEDESLCA